MARPRSDWRDSTGAFVLDNTFIFKQQINRASKQQSTREALLASLADAWSDPAELRAALQPTRVTTPTAAAGT